MESWKRGLGQTLPVHTLTLNFRSLDCERMNTVVLHHLVRLLSSGSPGKLQGHKAKNYGGEEVLSLCCSLCYRFSSPNLGSEPVTGVSSGASHFLALVPGAVCVSSHPQSGTLSLAHSPWNTLKSSELSLGKELVSPATLPAEIRATDSQLTWRPMSPWSVKLLKIKLENMSENPVPCQNWLQTGEAENKVAPKWSSSSAPDYISPWGTSVARGPST